MKNDMAIDPVPAGWQQGSWKGMKILYVPANTGMMTSRNMEAATAIFMYQRHGMRVKSLIQ